MNKQNLINTLIEWQEECENVPAAWNVYSKIINFLGSDDNSEPESQNTLQGERCHSIYEKIKEAWTPDKRSFEEAEGEKKSVEEILQKYVCHTYPTGHSLSGFQFYSKDAVVMAMEEYASHAPEVTDEEIENFIDEEIADRELSIEEIYCLRKGAKWLRDYK